MFKQTAESSSAAAGLYYQQEGENSGANKNMYGQQS